MHLHKKIVYRYVGSQYNTTIDSVSSHRYTNVIICKPFYSSVVEHVLLAVEEANQSQEEPEIAQDEDENRKIAAEELKSKKNHRGQRKRPFEHDL